MPSSIQREAASTMLALPFEAASSGVARRALDSWLADRGRSAAVEDCRLVVAELVGNAVRHARPLTDNTLVLACRWDDATVDIAVTDGGAATVPHQVDAGVVADSGRGLAIVDALAARWWIEQDPQSTTVHALVELV